jgi:flagellin
LANLATTAVTDGTRQEIKMALSVATNVGAMAASAAASSVNRDMNTSIERLSTGYRINSASDDVAGVSIASRLEADAMGLKQALRNASDAQNFLDTAEGAMEEVKNILLRIRELAVQGSNATNSATDVGYLENEMTALEAEIAAIGTDTTWSDIEMLGADAGTFQFQVGTNAADEISITTTALTLANLSLDASAVTTNATSETYITTVDAAIETLNGYRTAIGEVSNRLNHTIANLSNNMRNVAEGLGRIKDTDFAEETTNLTKNQILQQAATAMLAQANASKQGVLSLLQG